MTARPITLAPIPVVGFDSAIVTNTLPAAATVVSSQPSTSAVVFVSGSRHASNYSHDGGSTTRIDEDVNGDRVIEDNAAADDNGAVQGDVGDPTLLSILDGWDCSDNFGGRLSDILTGTGTHGLQFNGIADLASQTVVEEKDGIVLAGAAGRVFPRRRHRLGP